MARRARTNRIMAALLGLTIGVALQFAVVLKPARAEIEFFPMPTALPPTLVLTPEQLVGMTLQIVDDAGPFWIDLRANGVVATVDAYGRPFTGSWRVDRAGHLCLKSRVWWKNSSCYALHGDSLAELEGIVVLQVPGRYFPASIYPTETN